MVKAGVRLPFLLEVWELLSKLGLAPSQIKPMGLSFLISCCMLWSLVLGREACLTLEEFLFLYRLVNYGDLSSFQARTSKFIDTPNHLNNPGPYEPRFFSIFGLGCELLES